MENQANLNEEEKEMNKVAKRIWTILIEEDLKMFDLAYAIDLNLGTVSRVVHGHRETWHVKKKIAKYFKVNEESLFKQ